MVHEGFTVSDGRTVLVRTDDLGLQERKDVSAFFNTVQRLTANDGSAQRAGVVAGCVVAIFVLIIVGFRVGDVPFAWSILGGTLLAMVFFGGTAYFVVREARFSKAEYKLREKILKELVALCVRTERCRIAMAQIQEMSPFHAKILVEVPLPATAG